MPYRSASTARSHTAGFDANPSGTPTRLPARSCGASIPALRFTVTPVSGKKRLGKTGSPRSRTPWSRAMMKLPSVSSPTSYGRVVTIAGKIGAGAGPASTSSTSTPVIATRPLSRWRVSSLLPTATVYGIP